MNPTKDALMVLEYERIWQSDELLERACDGITIFADALGHLIRIRAIRDRHVSPAVIQSEMELFIEHMEMLIDDRVMEFARQRLDTPQEPQASDIVREQIDAMAMLYRS